MDTKSMALFHIRSKNNEANKENLNIPKQLYGEVLPKSFLFSPSEAANEKEQKNRSKSEQNIGITKL